MISPESLGLSIIRPQRTPAAFFNQYENRGFNPGADQSGQHLANVFMEQSGLGDVGQDRSWAQGTMPSYGFSPTDYNNVNRFLANPLNQGNVDAYMGLVNRLKSVTQTNPQFTMWPQQIRNQWANDYPTQIGAGFGTIPPPILQSQNVPGARDSGLRF